MVWCRPPPPLTPHHSLVEHDLFGKPASTPDQVRGRHFPDHAQSHSRSCGAIKAIVGPVENDAREPRSKRGRHRNMWPPPAPGATRTSSRPAQRGGGDATRPAPLSLSSPPGLTRWSMPRCGYANDRAKSLSESALRMDCRVKPGNDEIENRSRDACASEFCQYDAQEAEPDPVMRRRRWIPAASRSRWAK